MIDFDGVVVAFASLQQPLIISALAAVMTACGILQYLSRDPTVRRLVSMLGIVHTVLWLAVLQTFFRFITTAIISWAFMAIMLLELLWLIGIMEQQARSNREREEKRP